MTLSLTTVYPFDPWGEKIGGIETAIRSMFRHSPADIRQSLIGLTESPQSRPPARWTHLSFQNQSLAFYPLASITDPNRRRFIPLFLRFPFLLRNSGLNLSDSLAIYHRLEPLAVANLPAKANLLWIHGDPREMVGKNSETKWRYLPQVYQKLEAIAVRKAQHIFVVSRSGLEYFHQSYPNQCEHISFLPAWYEDELFHIPSPDMRNRLRREFLESRALNPSDRFILFAGRWEEQKNPLLALEVFAQAAEKFKDIYLLLVGEGSLKPIMEESIRLLRLEDRISFLGSLSSTQMVQAILSSEMLLVTSRFEGTPIMVLEAQACGLPVVSTCRGEIDRMIRDGMTGRVVSESNPRLLAEAVGEILQAPQNFPADACARAVEAYRCSQVLKSFYDHVYRLVHST